MYKYIFLVFSHRCITIRKPHRKLTPFELADECTAIGSSIFTVTDYKVDYYDVINVLRYSHEENYETDGRGFIGLGQKY